MKQFLKITGYVLLSVLVCLYLVFLFVLPRKIDLNVYKSELQKIVKENTNLYIDFDRVDVSNLQRQVLFTTEDVGNLKAESALGRIKALNPDVDVVAYNFRFDAVNARKLVADYDVVLDATDDIGTKYLINDTCVENGTPFVHAAVNCYGGNVMTVVPGSACLRCVFPEAVKQKDSSEYGVFGAVPGIAGAVQAAEVVKLIAGVGEPLVNRMMSFDALAMKFNVISVVPSDLCVLRHSE